MQLEIELRDETRGGIKVYKIKNGYTVWYQLVDIGGSIWEAGGTVYNTLAEAMIAVSEGIKTNVKCELYD